MIAPRLELIRDLLSDTGHYWFMLDWRLVTWSRLSLDELFGKATRIDIIWKRAIWYYTGICQHGGSRPAYSRIRFQPPPR